MGERGFGRCRKGRLQRRARGGRGNGCHLGPICPTQRLTGPNGGRIVGGSMTEKNGFSLSTAYQNPAGRKVYGWAVPGFFLCPSAIGPSKVGAGASPQNAFGCQQQAKRSACPTRGWVKSASPVMRVATSQALSALRGDMEFEGYPAFLFVPRFRSKRTGSLAPQCLPQPAHTGLNLLGGAGTLPLPQSGHTAAHRRSRGVFPIFQEKAGNSLLRRFLFQPV